MVRLGRRGKSAIIQPASAAPCALVGIRGLTDQPVSEKQGALLVDDTRFDAHAPPGHHPERPERLVAARAGVRAAAGVTLPAVTARSAADEDLARVHDSRFIEALGKLRGQTVHLDPDTYVSA